MRFFASLREVVGVESLEVADCPDVERMLRQLADSLDVAAYTDLTAPSVRIAVNQTLVDGNQALAPGDEVAFLPPVTGG